MAIVSAKPQTTRRNQLGIFQDDGHQLIFVDTPGIHRPRQELGRAMVRQAERALRDAELILWLMDISEAPRHADRQIAAVLRERGQEQKLIIALNKRDLLAIEQEESGAAHLALAEFDGHCRISAITGEGTDALLRQLCALLPAGPAYFPADQLSDASMRVMAAELIRERVLEHCQQEVPHAVAVEISSYQEGAQRTDISALIYVEKDSQKGILIGRGGAMIKRLGQEARQALEEMLERHVYLDLRVKLKKNWRRDERFLKRLGYR